MTKKNHKNSISPKTDRTLMKQQTIAIRQRSTLAQAERSHLKPAYSPRQVPHEACFSRNQPHASLIRGAFKPCVGLSLPHTSPTQAARNPTRAPLGLHPTLSALFVQQCAPVLRGARLGGVVAPPLTAQRGVARSVSAARSAAPQQSAARQTAPSVLSAHPLADHGSYPGTFHHIQIPHENQILFAEP